MALGVWFFAGTRMSRDELIRVFFWFLVPVMGIGFLGMDAIASAGDIEFTLNSNYVTSGGYAPNQVSTVLGLASFACFLILVISSASNVVLKTLAFAGMLYFAGHTAVTMSRGGLYGAGAGMLAAGFFFAQSPRARGSLILGALLGGVLIWLLIFAFSRCPFKKEDEALRAHGRGGDPPPGYPPQQYPPQGYPQQGPPPGYR